MASLVTKLISRSRIINCHLKPVEISSVIVRTIKTDGTQYNYKTKELEAKEHYQNTKYPHHYVTTRKELNNNPELVLKLLNLAENDNLSNSQYIRLGNRGSLCITRQVISIILTK